MAKVLKSSDAGDIAAIAVKAEAGSALTIF